MPSISACLGNRQARPVMAASQGPCRANCLKQSLALWWLLRLTGIESALRIGVRKGPVGVEAHAWIECRGPPLNDREDVSIRFSSV